MTVSRDMSGVNWVFTPDTEFELDALAAFVNTAPGLGASRIEDLGSIAQALDFYRTWQWTGTRPATAGDLADLHAVRHTLHDLWAVARRGEADLVDRVNALLRDYRALPQLARHDNFGWHIHAVPIDAPFATRVAVEAAMALVDLIRAEQTDRLKVCIAADCDSVLIDLSKNHSRKFCDTACANRTHAAAYRARKSTR